MELLERCFTPIRHFTLVQLALLVTFSSVCLAVWFKTLVLCKYATRFIFINGNLLPSGPDWPILGGCHLSIMQSWAWAILLQGQGGVIFIPFLNYVCLFGSTLMYNLLLPRPASNTTVALAGIGSTPWTSSVTTALWCATRRSGMSTETTHGSTMPQPWCPLRLLPLGHPFKRPSQELWHGETL